MARVKRRIAPGAKKVAKKGHPEGSGPACYRAPDVPRALRQILVVEPDEALRQELQLVLREAGYEALGVPSVQEAAALMQTASFTLVSPRPAVAARLAGPAATAAGDAEVAADPLATLVGDSA